jgi:hypothetical protein
MFVVCSGQQFVRAILSRGVAAQLIQSLKPARRPYRAVAVKRLRRPCDSHRPLRDDRADATGRLAPKAFDAENRRAAPVSRLEALGAHGLSRA